MLYVTGSILVSEVLPLCACFSPVQPSVVIAGMVSEMRVLLE